MSLILEALKKSESRRRLGEAPDLGTPFTVPRRRRNPLPWIALLVVAASAFGWWYLRAPPVVDGNTISASVPRPAPPAANSPLATPQRSQPATPTMSPRAPAASLPATSAGQNSPALQHAPNAANRMQPGSVLDGNPSQPSAPGTATMRAANRNSMPAVPPQTTAPQATTSPPVASTPPAAVAKSTIPAPVPAVGPAANPPPVPAPSVVASGPGVQKADPNAAANNPVNAAPAAPASAVPAGPPMPLYYELPYNTRKDIPPIVLSMHVFSADAATRFVVVDGERKTQGDSLKEGLKLDEIRPDGMVLEFRGQRFFYPRSGH